METKESHNEQVSGFLSAICQFKHGEVLEALL